MEPMNFTMFLNFLFNRNKATSITNDITTGATVSIGEIELPDLETNKSLACSSITSKQSGRPAGCELNAKEVYTYSKTTTISKKLPVVCSKIINVICDRH